MQFPSESRAKTHIHLQWNIHELNSTLKGLKNLNQFSALLVADNEWKTLYFQSHYIVKLISVHGNVRF